MPHVPGHIETTTTTTQPFGGVGSGDATGGGSGVDEDFYTRIESILDGTTSSTKTPLGNGYLKEYEVQLENQDPEAGPTVKLVPVEEFLTSDEYQSQRRELLGQGAAYKYVYMPVDIGAQARLQTPYIRVQTKNLLAAAGLIDLNKTVGAEIDNEYLKGIKAAMEFSMNNGGQMSWVAGLKVLASATQGSQLSALGGGYSFGDEALNEFVDEMVSKAETRKGSPLSNYEKQYITAKLTDGPAEEFRQSLTGLGAGTSPTLSYDIQSGQAIQTPGTGADEPDIDILTEGGEDVLDEIFEPREELQRQANVEDQTFYRMQRNLAGLKSAESQPVQRLT
tara:strand:- start:609 stop:1616 length:1008 start_codon:yes stop_codon:yes gene_type:complete